MPQTGCSFLVRSPSKKMVAGCTGFLYIYGMTQIAEVLARFGNVREAADKIGRAPSVIQYWKTAGRIPATAQQAVLDAAERHGVTVAPSDLISARPSDVRAAA